MKPIAVAALSLAACLVSPVQAGQDNKAWWDCTLGYLGKRNLVDGKTLESIAVDAVFACEDVSVSKPSNDYDVVMQLITRYRSYHNEPPARPR